MPVVFLPFLLQSQPGAEQFRCAPVKETVPLQFEIEDGPFLKSDGKGAYQHDSDCIWAGIFVAGDAMLASQRPGPPGVLNLPWNSDCRGAKRWINLTLDRPAQGSDAKPLGTIRSTAIKLKFFHRIEGNSFHSLLEMPVGSAWKSPWTQIAVDNLDLKFATGPVDTCGFKLKAAGVTPATLTRTAETEWLLDVPSGSIGHLSVFETYEQDFERGTGGSRGRRTAEGLYEFSTRIRIKTTGPAVPLFKNKP